MKRLLSAVMVATLLAALVPGVASAGRVSKEQVNRLSISCFSVDEAIPADAFFDRDLSLGDQAFVEAWLDGADPELDPPSLLGSTESVEISMDVQIDISATVPVTDIDGNPLGDAEIAVTVAPDGDPFFDFGSSEGNLNSHTVIRVQPLFGGGVLTLPDDTEVGLECFGERAEGEIHQSNPTAFSFRTSGVSVECSWEIEDGFVFLFGSANPDFAFLDAGIVDAEMDAFGDTESLSLDASGVSAEVELVDFISGGTLTGDVEASFTPDGDPVSSLILGANAREKLLEQRLAVDGTFTLTPGDSYPMDGEHCFALAFESHRTVTAPRGPRHGKAPANDSPDGAIALDVGTRLNTQTTGTDPQAEVPNLTCGSDSDLMGHTLWYTIEGTGDEVTIDSGGSNFDTIIAVYVEEGGELVELACVDDQFFDPAGASLQSLVSVPTDEGVTYWIQVGGWGAAFEQPEAGRLRLTVS